MYVCLYTIKCFRDYEYRLFVNNNSVEFVRFTSTHFYIDKIKLYYTTYIHINIEGMHLAIPL